METTKILKKKICMIGTYGVGKTSLIRRYVFDQFDDKYLSTIGVKVTKKIMPPIENHKKNLVQLELLIWDVEGYDKKLNVLEDYYTGSVGAIAVADVSRPETIDQLGEVVNGYLNIAKQSKIVIVANKIDLFENMPHTLTKLKQYVMENSLELFYTSAKTGKNVEPVFQMLGTLIVNDV